MSKVVALDSRIEVLRLRFFEVGQVFKELYLGFQRQDEKLLKFILVSNFFAFAILMKWDVLLFKRLNLWHFYPPDGVLFRFYVAMMTLIPILCFGVWVRNSKKVFSKSLKRVFDLVGLRNAIGSYPNFLSLEVLSGGTMKLLTTNGGFTLDEWQSKKERLEANLKIYIDELRQVKEKGFIETTFSYDPMPAKVTIENIWGYRSYRFLFGRDRTKNYLGNFSESPHLLVAGETGKGKSAFLRQLVTTIKLNQPEAIFHLVDLKGGVEFGHFDRIPGMKVISEVSSVAKTLRSIVGSLKVRTQALKERKLSKIEEFFDSHEFKEMTQEKKKEHVLGQRVFVVVDECAEIFLFGLGHAASDTREIRGLMSRLARLGRACGVHLILGTQRPDKNAVDPQVKSNMTTTVAFRISDHGGSLAILGTGRATDLPHHLPGRAILKQGSEEFEIQTPFLDINESIKLLEKKFKLETKIDEDPTLKDQKGSDETIKKPDTVE